MIFPTFLASRYIYKHFRYIKDCKQEKRGILILYDYPWCFKKVILFSGLVLLCFNTPVTPNIMCCSPFVSLPSCFFATSGVSSLSAKRMLDISHVKWFQGLEELNSPANLFVGFEHETNKLKMFGQCIETSLTAGIKINLMMCDETRLKLWVNWSDIS